MNVLPSNGLLYKLLDRRALDIYLESVDARLSPSVSVTTERQAFEDSRGRSFAVRSDFVAALERKTTALATRVETRADLLGLESFDCRSGSVDVALLQSSVENVQDLVAPQLFWVDGVRASIKEVGDELLSLVGEHQATLNELHGAADGHYVTDPRRLRPAAVVEVPWLTTERYSMVWFEDASGTPLASPYHLPPGVAIGGPDAVEAIERDGFSLVRLVKDPTRLVTSERLGQVATAHTQAFLTQEAPRSLNL